MKSVSFLWVPATLFLVLAGSWFALMELLLLRPVFEVRAAIAALIVLYGFLCMNYSRSRDASMRPVIALCAVGTLALGLYAIYAALHADHFEGYHLLIAAALIGQSLLTLAEILPGPQLHSPRANQSF